MKQLLPLFLLLFLATLTNAQLKIDSNYTLISRDVEFKNGAVFLGPFKTDSLWVKEVASGKICKLVSAEWTSLMHGEVFHDKSLAEAEIHLPLLRPKDKLFIERIKLEPGCFLPPKQIVIGVN